MFPPQQNENPAMALLPRRGLCFLMPLSTCDASLGLVPSEAAALAPLRAE